MINLIHLRYFLDAARLGSLSSAASLHSVSQSAVSQAIRSLETTLNSQLTTHARNRFELTLAGARLVEVGPSLIEAAASLEKQISATSEDTQPLVIGATTSLASAVLPKVISRYRQRHPRWNLQLKIGNSEAIRSWLANGEIALGLIVDDGVNDPQVKKTLFKENDFVLYGLPKAQPSLGDVGVLVTRRERPEVKKLMRRYQAKKNQILPIAMEVVSWEVIRSFVLSGIGYGFSPRYVVEKDLATNKLKELRLGFDPIAANLVALQMKSSMDASKRMQPQLIEFFQELERG